MAIALLVPFAAQAAGIASPIVPQCDGPNCGCKDLVQLASNILNAIVYLSVFASAVIFAWAGWWFMTGKTAGNSGHIEYAKNVIWNVMIGLVIILAAWLIVDTLIKTLTNLAIWTSMCAT
jgi:hypothetical protein